MGSCGSKGAAPPKKGRQVGGSISKKQYSFGRDPSLRRDDFIVSGRDGETIVRPPGAVAGQQFVVENCRGCEIWVLDHTAAVSLDQCEDCFVVVGPCETSVFARLHARARRRACRQFAHATSRAATCCWRDRAHHREPGRLRFGSFARLPVRGASAERDARATETAGNEADGAAATAPPRSSRLRGSRRGRTGGTRCTTSPDGGASGAIDGGASGGSANWAPLRSGISAAPRPSSRHARRRRPPRRRPRPTAPPPTAPPPTTRSCARR